MSNNAMAVPPDLTGQVALVTGAGRGLGCSFAHALATAGATVAVASRSADQLEETVARITGAGGKAMAIPADTANPHDVERLVTLVHHQLGALDLLINNAAIVTPLGPAWEVEPDAWWQCLEINVRGPFLCSRAVLPRMVARRRGRIINMVGGLVTMPHYSAYSTSKVALIRFTETLAAETRPYSLSIFALHPGFVRTPMTEYLAGSDVAQRWAPHFADRLTAGGDVSPDLAVRFVLWLASGRGDRLTGRLLNVTDDVTALMEHAVEIEERDLYTMRRQVL